LNLLSTKPHKATEFKKNIIVTKCNFITSCS